MIKKEVYLGLIAFIYGLLILFEKYLLFPVIFNKNLISFVIFLFGLIFLYNSIKKRTKLRLLTTITASLMVILGLFPLLINLRLLTSLPFIPLLRIPLYLYAIILIAFGIYKIHESLVVN